MAKKKEKVSEKKLIKTFFCNWFLGIFGVHHFYVGRKKDGRTMLILTCTLVGILVTSVWSFINFIQIISGTYVDGEGLPVKKLV